MSLLYFKDPQSPVRRLIAEMMDDHSGAVWTDDRRGKYPREYDMERVASIAVPTLLIAGELDKVFVKLARELHDQMPNSELIIYPGIGHMVNLEAPDRFNDDLSEFLNSLH